MKLTQEQKAARVQQKIEAILKKYKHTIIVTQDKITHQMSMHLIPEEMLPQVQNPITEILEQKAEPIGDPINEKHPEKDNS